jgi:biopolymer transport protein ExbD
MAPKSLDIWLTVTNTIYKGVPYSVATGWAEQGRLASTDKVRPAGGSDAEWSLVSANEFLADYLYHRGDAAQDADDPEDAYEKVEIDPQWPKSLVSEDDDVDMIPLIDISLVLLIFFMMTSVVSSFSPVQVPGLKYGTEISAADTAITIMIERDAENKPLYSLQIGNTKPIADETAKGDQDKLLIMLDTELTKLTKVPDVRIACHEQLPRSYVQDLCVELQKRVEKQLIARYSAEVNEKAK